MIFRPSRRLLTLPRLVLLVLLIALGLLIHTAWPFLFYPATTLSFNIPAPRPSTVQDGNLAGVAEVDITPAIGLPKFGYSAWARSADGFRTRLKARAFYLHGAGQTPMALVQLDLGAGSLPLQYAVAERIAAATDIPAHALSLLVTHTHSGPGQYLGSDFYNVFGSQSPGFDPVLFDFLAKRISQAVIEAYRARRPARFASGQSEVWGLTRNRSLGAWARNHRLPEQQWTEERALEAINPRMSQLRIDLMADDGRYYPAGALTLFSIHGTAIPAFTRPYHADVWHWLAQGIEPAGKPLPWRFVHGTVQATHGDNNPAWTAGLRGDREARRIGTALGEQANTLFHQLGHELRDDLHTAVASRELDLLKLDEEQRHGLCQRPIIGAAVAGAANGDEVFPISYLPYLKEGWPRTVFTDGCQGVKQWMLSKLQLALAPARYPHRALFQVLRINDLVLVALPWEITLESGNRIRAAVSATLPDPGWTVAISSLANGYFGYATTEAEYGAQYYEGGHTLYGPHTVDFLSAQSARLSNDLFQQGNQNQHPGQATFVLRSHRYWPEPPPERTWSRQWQGEARYMTGDATHEPYWRWRFRGEPAAALPLHLPLMAVVDEASGKVLVDDDSGDLQLLLVEDQGVDGALYEVRWHTPSNPGHPGDRALHILAGAAPRLVSPIF
ncbi:neutral/alkaline non-lysosomal ceramidase N-terminal domain-containing protein [Alloalcanivorax xenomutans]|uniref:neutral/alkaline non-lysosomal ceramidase N-terminal domain-containing protein n=1 Tax=Alloalcanivorax xenomutans TaxID=1094342 RepID=UPI003BACD1C3